MMKGSQTYILFSHPPWTPAVTQDSEIPAQEYPSGATGVDVVHTDRPAHTSGLIDNVNVNLKDLCHLPEDDPVADIGSTACSPTTVLVISLAGYFFSAPKPPDLQTKSRIKSLDDKYFFITPSFLLMRRPHLP